jgi:site-specific recombinase XerD
MESLTLSQCIAGYEIYAQAKRLSPHTLADYHNAHRKLQTYLEADLPIEQIEAKQISAFMSQLTYLKPKTARNIHTALSSLWQWAMTENIVKQNIVRSVVPPKPDQVAIDPLSKADVKALLGHLKQGRAYARPGKRECSNTIPTATRNHAIILLLLDTGARASEICELRVIDCDLKNSQITVWGKGRKQRIIPISLRTAQAIWRYLSERKSSSVNQPLFVTPNGNALGRDDLFHILQKIGERASVPNVHPHRFRHTFAINFLRNGGNVYALQALLGHTALDMCKRYLALGNIDMNAAHAQASPVANWNL